MTIKVRITLLLAMALFALVVISGVGLFQLSAAQSRFEYISSNTFPSLKALQTAQQSLSHIRIALRNHAAHANLEKKQLDEKDVATTLQVFDKAIDDYEKQLADEPEDRKMAKQDKDDMARYRTAMAEFYNNSRANYLSVANAQLDGGDLYQLAGRLEDDLNKHLAYKYQSAGELIDVNQSAYNQARWLQTLLAAMVLVGVAAGGFLLIRSIVRSLSAMQNTMEKVSKERDFALRVASQGKDEISLTAKAFNSLLEGLQSNLRELKAGSQDVVTSSNEMAQNANAIYRVAAMQSESSSAVASTIDQMAVSVNHVAERASEAQDLSRSSSEKADAGSATISQTIRDIREISQAIGSASSSINGLNQQSSQIVSVVQVIRDVADQTNLLALNAAIEAARAGEMGRGFAVVADEVRKLAERTASSTSEISSSLQAMQREVEAVVSQMKTAEEVAKVGVARADAADQAIQGIGSAAADTTRVVIDISSAIKEQGTASKNIAQQVEQIVQMSEQANDAASRSATSSDELKQLAERQMQIIAQYKL
ncbi:methyl-accepting chemotaxis protein [Crenobacter sp. SG2303]|uniref:Methyl-accepting chemotaxis protein n=1 Tax=Crenobacter oryzisoli TaxID=3056844 RepID=A0ABT7XUR2_9NEIS|nr:MULTISPECIES: methyl-accepting chemotaxis protein [unclassified Crenobacter]MDN0077538.1 methyl-accepting chemotaxis protein [Crenobacter sp. SG2303]MDN0081799.1 methyl-accepting chemotaxis protein [Crenobacter sp. SG2305]